MNTPTPFNVTAGGMTWWSLGQQTDPAILQNGLTQFGLPDYSPKPRSWPMSLKAALAEMFTKPEELIRPLKNRKRDGYTVVVEEKGVSQNTYTREVNASVDPESGRVQVTAGYADVTELQRLTNHFHRVLPSSSVSDMLTNIIHEQLGGISLKANGGLYFIPEDSIRRWQDIIMVVEAAAVEPTANDLSVVPLELNAMTLRDIKRSICREVESEAERLRKDIVENSLGTDALLNRAVRASQLRDRIRQYEQILGQALDVCHQNLDIAVQAFSVATAVKDDADIYDGVFA
jgi:hypothetical protein